LDYSFIDSDKKIEQVCRNLLKEEVIGVDLESDSLHSFREKICLIQVATRHQAFLIDPFKINNMAPFVRVLENSKVKTVFHGADYDIRSLDRDYQARVKNLFDTEIACRFLGIKERGLASLLKKHFNVTINKKFQKEDWAKRPLDPEMIAYSVGDVAYLLELHHIISRALEEKGRLSWAEEEFSILAGVRHENNHKSPLFEKFKGAGKLDKRTLAVLEKLLQMRVALGHKKDRPLFKIISNASIMNLALIKPLSIEKILEKRILSPKQIGMYGKLCVAAVNEAMNLDEQELPVYPVKKRYRKDKQVEKRIKKLKKMREEYSRVLDIEPGFLLNNALIEDIATNNPNDPEELADINTIRRWQIKALGETIILNTKSQHPEDAKKI
jgi:ribonuclease D